VREAVRDRIVGQKQPFLDSIGQYLFRTNAKRQHLLFWIASSAALATMALFVLLYNIIASSAALFAHRNTLLFCSAEIPQLPHSIQSHRPTACFSP
jgi:hypothetical protein